MLEEYEQQNLEIKSIKQIESLAKIGGFKNNNDLSLAKKAASKSELNMMLFLGSLKMMVLKAVEDHEFNEEEGFLAKFQEGLNSLLSLMLHGKEPERIKKIVEMLILESFFQQQKKEED